MLEKYLQQLTEKTPLLRGVAPARLGGLPIFLSTAGQFREWQWLGQKLILVEGISPDNSLTVAELQTRHRILADHFKLPVVLVFPHLDSYRRNRLLQLQIPFIVPERQLFIPPFAALSEQFQQAVNPGVLSAVAQVTVLYQLLRRPPDGERLNLWASRLGYSPMTMTKVRDELAANGLCKREAGDKPRGLFFACHGQELWHAARSILRSPVRQYRWAQFSAPPPSLVRAGISALSDLTMLGEDPIPTYACRDSEWKQLLATKQVRMLELPDDATAQVECWRYAPEILAEDGRADRLSLLLSLADSADERVRIACNELLEQMPW